MIDPALICRSRPATAALITLLLAGASSLSASAASAAETSASPPSPPRAPQTYTADADWKALTWAPARVTPGSALDFSPFLDAPAGKHGRVIVRDGQFAFEQTPDRPVHFYGTVVGHALPYLDKARCEQLADYLAATGYSAIRLHNYIFAKGVMKETGSAEFTPEAEDQLDYFFFCLKKRGIYFTFPINAWGFFKAGDVTDVPEFRNRAFRFESNGLLPVSPDAQRWFREYSRRLLTHVNRYTGLALKDEPALISLELANEDSLLSVLGQYPELVPVYRRLAQDELRTKLQREPTQAETEKELPLFVLRTQERYVATMTGFLRELGLRQPLTDLNFRDNEVYALPRSQLDYVDIHSYWALYHVLPGAKDGAYQQTWANPNTSGWSNYLGVTAGRLFGKPYMNTEFNSCYPTPYWSFIGPVEAALAGGQGWSGIFRCGQEAQPATFFNATPMRRISASPSPIIMFSERIGALLFAQQEVPRLPVKLPFVVTQDYLLGQLTLAAGPRYPRAYQRLAFQYELGTVVLDGHERLDDFPCVVIPPDMAPPPALVAAGKKIFRADDALETEVESFLHTQPSLSRPATRLQLDPKSGSGQISTARSETFLLADGTDQATGNAVSVRNNHTVAVCFAGSLDRRPLAESGRMLVLYLTDLKNTGTQIEPDPKAADSVIVRQPGELPLLLRQASIELNFRHTGKTLPEIWALRYDGSRTQKLAPHPTADGFAFTAQAMTAPDTFAAYEVVWP